MKMRKLTFGIFAAVLMSLLATPAMAGTVWSQSWVQDTTPVTKIELFMMVGSFGSPDVSGLGPSWTVNQPNPGYMLATSTPPSVSRAYYTINFGTPSSDSLTLDALEWNGATVQEHLRFVWRASNPGAYNTHSGKWSWNQPSGSFIDGSLAGTDYDRSTVPEPGTLGLFAGGLIGIGLLGKQRLRYKAMAKISG